MKAQHPRASMVLMSHPSVGTIVPLPLPDSDYRELVSVLMDLSTGVDLPSTFQAVARGLSRLTSFDWLCISYRGPRDSTISMHSSHSGRPEWLAHTAELVAPRVAFPDESLDVGAALVCARPDEGTLLALRSLPRVEFSGGSPKLVRRTASAALSSLCALCSAIASVALSSVS